MLSDPDTARPLLLLLLLLRLDIAFVSFTPDSAAQRSSGSGVLCSSGEGCHGAREARRGSHRRFCALLLAAAFSSFFYGYKFLHLF